MIDIRTHARLLADSLTVNESTKADSCPSCGGGSTRRKTFSVTRNQEGVLYNCYRASCDIAGFVPTAAPLLSPSRKVQKLREYFHAVNPILSADLSYFRDRFQLDPTLSSAVIKLSEFSEYIFPIYNTVGLERGYVVRQPIWSGSIKAPLAGQPGKPKSQTFPHVREPMQSFYQAVDPQISSYLVIVEDQLSAIKASQAGLNSVALLGTHANNDKVREWSSLRPETIIIALDRDATSEAFKIARKYGLAFPNTRVSMLDQDVKDTDKDDILHILGVHI